MDPYIGAIQAFAFSFAPRGWFYCQGQILSISAYQALYSLLGPTFGGDGRTTFALPDLRGRTIVGAGSVSGLLSVNWGQKGGAETISASTLNLPAHFHTIANGTGTTVGTAKVTTTIRSVDNTNESPETNSGENVLGTAGSMPSIYRESLSGNDYLGGTVSAISGTTAAAGGGIPAQIRNPYLGLYYCIAATGLYPSRP